MTIILLQHRMSLEILINIISCDSSGPHPHFYKYNWGASKHWSFQLAGQQPSISPGSSFSPFSFFLFNFSTRNPGMSFLPITKSLRLLIRDHARDQTVFFYYLFHWVRRDIAFLDIYKSKFYSPYSPFSVQTLHVKKFFWETKNLKWYVNWIFSQSNNKGIYIFRSQFDQNIIFLGLKIGSSDDSFHVYHTQMGKSDTVL